jgi:hypothetical protein
MSINEQTEKEESNNLKNIKFESKPLSRRMTLRSESFGNISS